MAGLIPDSFALNGSGNVVLQNPEPTPQGSGTQMGGPVRVASTQAATAPVAPASNFGQIAQADMKTLDTLNKLAGGILQPLIAQQQKRQYYEGMSEVAQGRALQGIEKEHPWYLDIFGPSATVRGAQAMTAMTAITQAQSQFLEQMPTLRTQSPDQVRQFLVNQASSLASTGDGTVDTLIQAKLAEAWGPMLETHMKQHVAWMQQDMVQKQVNMNLSNAQNLAAQRQAHGGVGWDPIDQARAYAGVVNAAAPAPGQNQQSWSKGMVSAMRGALQNGNFDFYNAIKGSELWGKIDPTARENLEYMMPLFVQKNALSNPLTKDITSDTAGLSFALQHGVSGIHSADQLDTTIADMNARYSKLTGSVDPLINNVQAAAMHKAWLAGNLSMAKAAAALQAKQDNYNTSGLLVGQAFNSGRWDMLKGLPINQRAAAQFMDMAFDQAAGSNDPGKLQTFFAKASQASNDPLLRSQKLTNIFKTQIAPLVSGTGPMTDQQKQALNYAQLMYQTPTGQAALVNYLGDDAPKVVALLHSGADLSDPKELGAAREAIAKGWAAVPNKAEKVAAANVVNSADPGWFTRIMPIIGGAGELTPFNLSTEFKANLATQLAPQVAMYVKAYNLPADEAATMALTKTMQNADLVPGAIISHNPAFPANQSLAAMTNALTKGKGLQSTQIYQDALSGLIKDELTTRVKASGQDMSNFDPSDWEVRSGEQLGNGTLALFLWNKNAKKAAAGPVRIIVSAGKSVDDPNGLASRIENMAVQQARGTASLPPATSDLTPVFP